MCCVVEALGICIGVCVCPLYMDSGLGMSYAMVIDKYFVFTLNY